MMVIKEFEWKRMISTLACVPSNYFLNTVHGKSIIFQK